MIKTVIIGHKCLLVNKNQEEADALQSASFWFFPVVKG
jgi:hypothetical protein